MRPVLNLYRPTARLPIICSKTFASSSSSTSNTRVSSAGPQAPLEYCSSLVKRLDPEAWLCSYFWPQRERSWWLAWRAFNLELHSIGVSVKQPALAAMRFQFWKDVLKTIYTSDSQNSPVPQHPVALLLTDLKQHRPVQRYYLNQMIDVRTKTMSLPPAAASLESHISIHTPLSTALLLGPLPILLPPADPSTAHISHTLSHVSTLLTVVSLLRNLPILVTQKRQTNIPADLCEKHGLVEEELFRKGAQAKGLKDACWEIGTRGMDELITARRDLKENGGKVVPRHVMPIFLSAVPAENYLKKLEKSDFDVFHPNLEKHDWQLAPKIWYKYQRARL
ncbi:uncharacterized protein L203_104300 [Cryptococcus depauperatus CBS 7841]|uniref:Uncharacterized protein n=1 Tax=Cryptococcus depauperatus CBS 7841 TaxID=1295531 RepID=A0A1E3I5W1_9TREE|nr:hypothetical protein L203_05307 [Cryptococcus depauperatus CBS 7841]